MYVDEVVIPVSCESSPKQSKVSFSRLPSISAVVADSEEECRN